MQFSKHEVPVLDVSRAIGLIAIAVLTWFGVFPRFHGIDVVAVTAMIVCGFEVVKEALENVLERRMTMELSMTLAIAAAAAIGEYFTAEVILAFVIVAEMLEELTVERGRSAVHSLADLLPSFALLQRGEETVKVPVEQLESGDIILVKPGAAIPADGEIVRGHSFVEETSITGEAVAAEKFEGRHVYAGTVNGSGLLEVRCKAIGRETVFGRILAALDEASTARAPIERIADRLAGYLVYFALLCAALTLLVTRDLRSTISVIIVAGACGVAAGTPLAILGALGTCARRGAIIKGGRYVETLSKVDTVVLDKTGTVTFGDPVVLSADPAPGCDRKDLLATAVAVEKYSDHPMAKAILEFAGRIDRPSVHPEDFEYVPGKGIRARLQAETVLIGNRSLLEEHGVETPPDAAGNGSITSVLVARDRRFLGTIRIADRLRDESVQALTDMRAMGLRVIMMTGDIRQVASTVAKQLGVDEVRWGLLPNEKADAVERLRTAGRTVVTVGDGINDAPALARSSVGVAMASGADITRQTANVLLVGNDLCAFVDILRIARRCRKIILFNFTGTLAVDLAGIGLAAAGLLNPLLAAFIHVASELTFIANSARLIPTGKRPKRAPSTLEFPAVSGTHQEEVSQS